MASEVLDESRMSASFAIGNLMTTENIYKAQEHFRGKQSGVCLDFLVFHCFCWVIMVSNYSKMAKLASGWIAMFFPQTKTPVKVGVLTLAL